MTSEHVERKLAAIFAADVVGYSRLTGVDEEGTMRRLRALRAELIGPAIQTNRGRLFHTAGDSILIEFASVVDAVRCSLDVQRGVAVRNGDLSSDKQIQLRVGIHLGDVMMQPDGDLLGDGVNIAARLEGIAAPGGICLSEDAYRQVRDKLKESFLDIGEQMLKNIARPVRVYRLDLASKDTTATDELRLMPAQSDKPSIAVLAFNNMSGDPEQEYFSDGISEDIITDLSKLSELHVIARNSSFTYKGKPVDVMQVGRDLRVRYVLEGSVRKAGNRVRVTGQLIDAESGAHIWADRFDRDLTDIFAVQDELTQEIIAALKVKLTPERKDRLARKGKIDVEAYNLFLRGRERMWLHTRSGNVEARAMLGRAIAVNLVFAAAQACIAVTHVNDYINGWAEIPEQSLQTGLEIAARAILMDDEDPYAHGWFAVALLWHREHDRALAEVQRCLALAPNLAEGHMAMAHIQICSGDAAGAIDTINTCVRLDPHYPDLVLYFLAEARISLGQFDEAVAALKQRLERNPNSETSYALLAACYGHLGRIAESRAAWAEVIRIAPDFSIERRRRILPFKNPDDFERRIEGMRKADIPV